MVIVRRCMRASQDFGVVLIRAGAEVGPAEMYEVGTTAQIRDFNQLSDGFLGLTCEGGRRFRIHSHHAQSDGLNVGEVEWLAAEPTLPVPERHARLPKLLQNVLPQLGEVYTDIPMHLDDAAWVGHRLPEILPIPLPEKQACLQLDDPIQRLDV